MRTSGLHVHAYPHVRLFCVCVCLCAHMLIALGEEPGFF